MLRRFTSRPGFVAFMLGVVLVAEILAIRIAFTADNDWVYVFGRPINIVCAAKQQLGIPCPTCGFTRGFVLTLYGNIGDAWRLSPSGPLAVIAGLLAAIAFFVFAFLQSRGLPAGIACFKRWIYAATLVYCTGGTIVWLATWISVVRNIRVHS